MAQSELQDEVDRSVVWLATLVAVFFGGACALAWQLLWQIELALAIGASVKAVAITVAVTMGGMAAGALYLPRVLRKVLKRVSPLTLFGILEVSIAFFATLPFLGAPLLQRLDTFVYREASFAAAFFPLVMLGLSLGPAAFLMGATVPLFGRLVANGRVGKWALSSLYAWNILGAVFMIGLVAFALLPEIGREKSTWVVWFLHAGAGCIALFAGRRSEAAIEEREELELRTRKDGNVGRQGLSLAFVSGLAILALEVIWFRLLRMAWLSTTDAFALMLMSFLLALYLGARLGSWRIASRNPSLFLFLGAILALLATPFLERFDGWSTSGGAYGLRILGRIFLALTVMGPPVVLMGVCLPVLLDRASNLRSWGRLYGFNTLGAVLGSLGAAWILFPLVGPVASSWVIASLTAIAAFLLLERVSGSARMVLGALGCLALAGAVLFSTGLGISRVAGPTAILRGDYQVVAHRDAPDSSTSVVQIRPGGAGTQPYRLLFIDGYAASGEFGPYTHYMVEMGRLPMVFHPQPNRALVICYGTGQTVNAVRNFGAKRVDVADINPAVFELSRFFHTNEKVLEDERVHPMVMDGRAWLRRSSDPYDVVTLEPMPPFFAGSNSLYSKEFYEQINDRLEKEGIVAQWFPMHLMSTSHARSVAAAFVEVFPSSILWIDPRNRDSAGVPQQGILLGYKGSQEGLQKNLGDPVPVDVALMPAGLKRFVGSSEPVTDDNQLLAYGSEGMHRYDLSRHHFARKTYEAVREAGVSE